MRSYVIVGIFGALGARNDFRHDCCWFLCLYFTLQDEFLYPVLSSSCICTTGDLRYEHCYLSMVIRFLMDLVRSVIKEASWACMGLCSECFQYDV